ncbi:coiled-coil domain-containing protein 113 [Sigmodon hispidus]
MSEEDSDSAVTDSQTEEDGELPVIQLCGLVEELSYGNSALKTETEMFEKYYFRLEPRDHRMPRLSAAEFSQFRGRRKSKARAGDRTAGLTIDQKLELVQKELEDTREEIRHMRANAERDLQYHEAIIEEAEIRWLEIQRAVHDFEKDIVKTISKKKGSILATQKVMKYIEDMNRRRDNMKDKLCLKNVSLKVQKKKMLLQLRQKEEVGEALHDVDFQQLKIENSQFLETIEARNQELIQLKLASGNTLQVLNTYKNKLHRAMEIYNSLDKEILLRNELLGKIEKESIQAEEMSLKGYRKAWNKMKTSNEQLQMVRPPGK